MQRVPKGSLDHLLFLHRTSSRHRFHPDTTSLNRFLARFPSFRKRSCQSSRFSSTWYLPRSPPISRAFRSADFSPNFHDRLFSSNLRDLRLSTCRVQPTSFDVLEWTEDRLQPSKSPRSCSTSDLRPFDFLHLATFETCHGRGAGAATCSYSDRFWRKGQGGCEGAER